jgi:hypothetical protein
MKIPSRVLLVVALFLVTAAAHAQVIKGCVDKNGSLRVVVGTDTCKPNESALSWNAVGPQGTPGTPGRDGRDGLPGIAGKDGKDGKDGSNASSLPPVPPVIGTAQFGDGSVFELRDFSFDVENPTTIGSSTGGAGAGKIKFNEFTIKKQIDAASPAFFKSCATGSHYPTVTITLHRAGAADATIDLGLVIINDIKYLAAPAPLNSLEQITFLAGSMKVTADGSVDCWDQVRNTACNSTP